MVELCFCFQESTRCDPYIYIYIHVCVWHVYNLTSCNAVWNPWSFVDSVLHWFWVQVNGKKRLTGIKNALQSTQILARKGPLKNTCGAGVRFVHWIVHLLREYTPLFAEAVIKSWREGCQAAQTVTCQITCSVSALVRFLTSRMWPTFNWEHWFFTLGLLFRLCSSGFLFWKAWMVWVQLGVSQMSCRCKTHLL